MTSRVNSRQPVIVRILAADLITHSQGVEQTTKSRRGILAKPVASDLGGKHTLEQAGCVQGKLRWKVSANTKIDETDAEPHGCVEVAASVDSCGSVFSVRLDASCPFELAGNGSGFGRMLCGGAFA